MWLAINCGGLKLTGSERKLFWDTLCSLDGKDLVADFSKLNATIKHPSFIYRYRPITVNSINALQNNKLYFSRSNYYDDPFDTYLHIDYKSIYQQLISTENSKEAAVDFFKQMCVQRGVDEKTIESNIKEINQTSIEQFFNVLVSFLTSEIQPLIRNTSMSVCFSESGLNETMWLKYADQYKGFCLVYSLQDDEKFLCGKQDKCQNCGVNKLKTPLYPMYYSDTRYNATKYAYKLSQEYLLRHFYPNMSAEEVLTKLDLCAWERERVTLIKSKCHEYDAEWRMILPCQMKEPVMREWIPDGIILGLKISDNDKRIVIEAARHAGIKHVYQSIIDKNGVLDAVELKEKV